MHIQIRNFHRCVWHVTSYPLYVMGAKRNGKCSFSTSNTHRKGNVLSSRKGLSSIWASVTNIMIILTTFLYFLYAALEEQWPGINQFRSVKSCHGKWNGTKTHFKR